LYPGSLPFWRIRSEIRIRRKQRLRSPLRCHKVPQEPIPLRRLHMLERLTAWTLVAIYYCVGCGVIVLGLRGAL